MLREDFGSIHLQKLAERLSCDMPTAIGYLELLWNYTADMAPQGNIGQCTDSAIARYCEYLGDPEDFIEALVQHNWLARDDTHRLLTTNWPKIARPWVKSKLKRMGLKFAEQEPEAEPDPPTGGLAHSQGDTVVHTFPTVGDNADWPLQESKLHEWIDAFPGVDVPAECLKALQWCRDNPSRRKTYGGMSRFLNQWLSRAQNDAGNRRRNDRNAEIDDGLRQVFGGF